MHLYKVMFCFALACFSSSTYSIEHIIQEKISSLISACNLNDGSKCTSLGFLYSNGRLVNEDLVKAKYYYKKGCNLDDKSACNDLGFMYAQGHGVEQDFAKAKELYEKACDLNNGASFINLGILYEKGNGVAQNYTKAGELYQKACSLKYVLVAVILAFSIKMV